MADDLKKVQLMVHRHSETGEHRVADHEPSGHDWVLQCCFNHYIGGWGQKVDNDPATPLTDEQAAFMIWLQESEQTLAEERRKAAGFNGERSDGGASKILERHGTWSDGFMMGMLKTPMDSIIYAEHAKEFKRITDPEWGEYQRLKEKFSGA